MAVGTGARAQARTATASLFRSSCRVCATEVRPAGITRETSEPVAVATAARQTPTRTIGAPGKQPAISPDAETRAAAARPRPRIAAPPTTSPKRIE